MNDNNQMSQHKMSRREFLKLGSVGAGLVIGINLSACDNRHSPQIMMPDQEGSFSPSAYLRIAPDNHVTIFVTESEMGQGVWNSLPMLVAEELEVDWSHIKVEHAPLLSEFGNQYTGGSNSVRDAWIPLRRAGAVARQMLINAAAKDWQVNWQECHAEKGYIYHVATGKKASFGTLASKAANLPVPKEVNLKDPVDFRLIGTSPAPLDTPAKIRGTAVFGSDIKLDGLLIATVLHCPVFGGKLKHYDDSQARIIKGVRHILSIDSGVVVVADNFWVAHKAQAALKIQWDLGQHANLSSEIIRKQYQEAINKPAITVKHRGYAIPVAEQKAKVMEADYEAPFQAHATMEPMCCTVHVHDGECDIWVSTQAPTKAQKTAAQYLLSKPGHWLGRIEEKLGGSPFKRIRVHTTFLGGGFGRRVEQDFVAEAVQIASVIDSPVKLIWSREEDIQHDFYRPYTYHRLRAIIGNDGLPTHWQQRIVGPEKYKSSGCASGSIYDIPNFQQEFVKEPYAVPTGFWRSVSCSQTNFASECFIDELAIAAGEDPYQYRRKLLTRESRMLAVMDQAAEKAYWGKKLPKGHYHGMAINYSHGSYVAQVVELSAINGIHVHKVTCVIDCGQVVNPDTVRAQMESSVVFALGACLKGAITIKNGRTQQSNFHDFPLLHMDETPQIDTIIVASQESPGGVGEPGVPPLAPAVANAIYPATGVRVKKLPIILNGVV